MLKPISCGVLLIPIIVLVQIVLLVGEGIVLTAGTVNSRQDQPRFSGLNIVLIDTSEYTRSSNGETFRGLPDSHDFSKEKDVFGLYVVNYCSGKKVGDAIEADYCTQWGKQLFDLQRLWRIWGVDMMQDNLIGNTPRLIFVGFATMFVATLLSSITLLLSFCSYYGMMITVVLSFANFVSTLATSIVCYQFTQRLYQQVPKLVGTGSGRLVVRKGYFLNMAMWIGCALAILSFISCCFVFWRTRKARAIARKQKKASNPGKVPFFHVVRRATGGLLAAKTPSKSNYKNLGEETAEVELIAPESFSDSRSRARSRLGSGEYSRDISRDVSKERKGDHSPHGKLLYDKGGVGIDRSEDTAYEPFRRAPV